MHTTSYICTDLHICIYTANPIWGDIFECCFKAQSSKLERLFSLKCGTRDVRALSFELSKMTPQVGLAVYIYMHIYMYIYVYIYAHIHMYIHICNPLYPMLFIPDSDMLFPYS